jgi:DNA protecting protein DprA
MGSIDLQTRSLLTRLRNVFTLSKRTTEEKSMIDLVVAAYFLQKRGVVGAMLGRSLFERGDVKTKSDVISFIESFSVAVTLAEWSNIEVEVLTAVDSKIDFILPFQKEWPEMLTKMTDAPLVMSVQGELPNFISGALSVVGSREPRRESEKFLDLMLPQFLAQRKVPIVSGGARGIDQHAHRIAMRCGVPTVIVIPAGLLRKYPKDWVGATSWALDIGACFISEYSPQSEMRKHHFLDRNRIIAALGTMSLIIEARRKSGTLITARHCADYGRLVGVVPGHPMDPNFSGNLELLADGACFVRSSEELVHIFDSEQAVVRQSRTRLIDRVMA